MALFGSKKNTKEEVKTVAPKATKKAPAKETTKASSVAKVSTSEVISSAHIILRPHITEKAGIQSEKNIYTFDINPRANKPMVKLAIQEIYKVTPRKINIAQVKSANKSFKGIVGKSSTGKKAYVFLKEGDKIEFI